MSKSRKPQLRQSAALDTYIKLMRAVESVSHDSMCSLTTAGLTISQFGALEALFHVGPLCLTELARKIVKTGGNLTLVVNNLASQGLVVRKQDSHDRRYVTVHLSKRGERLLRRVLPAHFQELEDRMSVLSRREQAQLARLCKKLGVME